MNAILERAAAHYAAQEKTRVEVPEWGIDGAPLVIFHTGLTVAERRKIFRADSSGRAPDGPTSCVRAVILKACDESGKRLFSEMDEHDLTHKVDSDVVGRIAASILVGVELDDGALDTEKKD